MTVRDVRLGRLNNSCGRPFVAAGLTGGEVTPLLVYPRFEDAAYRCDRVR